MVVTISGEMLAVVVKQVPLSAQEISRLGHDFMAQHIARISLAHYWVSTGKGFNVFLNNNASAH